MPGLLREDWSNDETFWAEDFNPYAAKINEHDHQIASIPSTVNLAALNAQVAILTSQLSTLVNPPSDFFIVQMGGGTSRAVGYGDFLTGFYVGRAFIAGKIIYQFDSPDASGNTTVETRRNGAQVANSSVTVSAANQVDTTTTDPSRTATVSQAFAIGDRISLYCSATGSNPGKGLRAWIYGVWA